ncbi:prolipoprotein diacylglyceryl transferase [Anaerorhabdus sp.]|uniref:prolipoprotein diacylglyceryl transferase n=1 Tax=Anaerorhabdus sp. TaxID=1872524 RepID=UPI002FCACE45
MTLFPDMQTLVQFGNIGIKWYAVLMIAGVGVTFLFSLREIKKCGYNIEVAEDLAIGCFLAGLVGARIWYCLFYDLSYYLADPIRILQIYNGGLAIQGGLLAGALYGLYYAKKHKLDFVRLADCIVPNMLIAQAIGRWGNFLNQEAHGVAVTEAYFKNFPDFIKNTMNIGGQYYVPTFLYESVLNLLGFILIYFVIKKLNEKYHFMKRGDGVYFYLVWYGWSRFIVEGMRTDSLMFGPIRMAQLMSVVFIVVGVLGYLGLFRKFMKNPKPLMLFDLDGTLLDTEPAILETYRHLFEKYRTAEEFDKDKQLEVLGPPLAKMFPKYFPDKNVDELIKEYREYNFKIHPEFVKPMENAEDLLKTLKEEGYKIGIVSTKFNDGVKLGLDLFNLTQYVDIIVGHNDVKHGKPDPEGIFKACELLNEGHDSCIYVGDSATDIYAAHNAGVYSIGYIFNEDRIKVLEDAKPNVIIRDLKEIKEIVKEDHPWTYNMM